MTRLKRKLIGLCFALLGIIGLLFSMNCSADHINFIGVLIFGFACFFGAKHAKDELHPITWLKEKWYNFENWLLWIKI